MKYIRHALRLIRFKQWWLYKIGPALGIFLLFGTQKPGSADSGDITHMLLLTAALFTAAVFTSVSNDLADITSDRIAGKPNRLSGWSRRKATVLLAGILSAGMITGSLLPGTLLKCCYLLLWITWILYSVEPFRAKKRGLTGPLLDASGSHVIPCLMAVLLSGCDIQEHLLPVILTIVWSFLWGVRGIAWHQLYDFEHDRKSLIKTMPGVIGYDRTAQLVEKLLFPAETAIFTLLLTVLQPLLLAPLLVCMAIELTGDLNGTVPRSIVHPGGKNWLFLTDYYTLVMPLSTFLVKPASNLIMAGILIVFFYSGYSERIFADYRALYRSWKNLKNKMRKLNQKK